MIWKMGDGCFLLSQPHFLSPPALHFTHWISTTQLYHLAYHLWGYSNLPPIRILRLRKQEKPWLQTKNRPCLDERESPVDNGNGRCLEKNDHDARILK
jgi:hypothetical protein